MSGAKSLFSGLSSEIQATVVGRRPDRAEVESDQHLVFIAVPEAGESFVTKGSLLSSQS